MHHSLMNAAVVAATLAVLGMSARSDPSSDHTANSAASNAPSTSHSTSASFSPSPLESPTPLSSASVAPSTVAFDYMSLSPAYYDDDVLQNVSRMTLTQKIGQVWH